MTDEVLRFVDVVVETEGKDPILAGVGWRVEAGQRWVVLGPNGAGKTTLLHIAATYRFPTRGQVSVLGHELGTVDLRVLRREIGYAGAELERLMEARLSVVDAVLTGSRAHLNVWHEVYDDDARSRARSLVADVGLAGLEERTLATLSQGERRRTHIARALMADPRLLLLDEAAAGLDIAGREHLITVLRDLAEGPLPAIVFVTHHAEEIPPGFTHALLLREGAVVQAGPIAEVLTSQALSACFGLPLEVDVEDGRYRARAASREPTGQSHGG